MPLTRSEQIDTLYSSVWAARLPDIQDNIFNARPLWAWFNKTNQVVQEDGGLRIEERLQYAENTSFKSIGKGGTVPITPGDFLHLSKWDWKTIAGSVLRYSYDEMRAKGQRAIGNLVTDNLNNAQLSFIKEMNRQLFGDGTGNGGLDIDGLDNIISTTPASGSVGGIDPATYAYWRNYAQDMTGHTMAVDGVSYMRSALNSIEDDEILCDVILTSQLLHEAYESEIQALQTVIPTEAKRNKIADLGFRALFFKEIPIFFDKQMPWTDRMYFINSKALRLIALSGNWFAMTSWKEIPNQPNDKVAQICTTANLVCNNRRRLGVLHTFLPS